MTKRATLCAEQRQSILDQRKERYQHSHNTSNSNNPIEVTVHTIDNHDVIQKMKQFHEEIIGSLKAGRCIICEESFEINEIYLSTRCHRDTKIPKLYSRENNMHPGPVLPKHSVSVFLCHSK